MRRSVIYLVTNKINAKRYVGVTRFPENRWNDHVRKALKNPETYFHYAIRKYGPDNFSVDQIASCIEAEYGSRVEREIIRDLKPEYNQTNGGEHTVGKRVPQEVVERIRAANKGMKRTPEQRARMSESRKRTLEGNPDILAASIKAITTARQSPLFRVNQIAAARKSASERVWSAESRAKLSAAFKGRRQAQDTIDKISKTKQKRLKCLSTGQEFDCCSDAAASLGISSSSLYKVLTNARESVKGLYFSYI